MGEHNQLSGNNGTHGTDKGDGEPRKATHEEGSNGGGSLAGNGSLVISLVIAACKLGEVSIQSEWQG